METADAANADDMIPDDVADADSDDLDTSEHEDNQVEGSTDADDTNDYASDGDPEAAPGERAADENDSCTTKTCKTTPSRRRPFP